MQTTNCRFLQHRATFLVVLQHQTTLCNIKQQIGFIIFQNVTLLFICILAISYFAFYWRSLKHRGLKAMQLRIKKKYKAK